jgi:regulator of sirC expression with transglutaminase-like and TPR domain
MAAPLADTLRDMVRARFVEVMAEEVVALDEASLLVSAALQPDLDRSTWIRALDDLAAACPDPTAEGVARFLFSGERFVGNRGAYYDWRNSCLDRVISTRTGIPISLSVLMIEVARRIGVPTVGIGMPAHFLVRAADDEHLFFDPFHGGRALDRSDAQRRFEAVTNGQVAWDDAFLDPTPNRDIVIRMLNNLKGVFLGRGDAVRLGIVMSLRATLPELAETEAGEITTATALFN